MDIGHYFQLGQQRLASQIRVPEISGFIRSIKNYSKFGIFFGSAIALGILGHTETEKAAIETWLRSNPVEQKSIERWMGSHSYNQSTDSKLIRGTLKTLPAGTARSEVWVAKNAPIAVTVSNAGAQQVFFGDSYRPVKAGPLEWNSFPLRWDQIKVLFDQLDQQIDDYKKTLKSRPKSPQSDPYELHY